MAADRHDDEAERLVEELDEDEYFRPWAAPQALPTDADLVDTARAVLHGGAASALPPLEGDGPLRKLVLLQIVAPYLDGSVRSWEAVFDRLSLEDRANVEALLGNDSLADLLRPEPRWQPPAP